MIRHYDHREPEILKDILLAHGWDNKRLPVGDYSFSTYGDKLALGERKTYDDLIGSYYTVEAYGGKKTSKLMRQLKTLGISTADYKFIILEGGPLIDRKNDKLVSSHGIEVSRKGINNLLRSAQIEYGIFVERTIDPVDTAERLLEMLVSFSKPIHSITATPLGSPGMTVLTLIRGIGTERAQKIWEHFQSLSKVANATEEELTNIAGIGKKQAQTIIEFFR